jgi:hypothetical protein
MVLPRMTARIAEGVRDRRVAGIGATLMLVGKWGGEKGPRVDPSLVGSWPFGSPLPSEAEARAAARQPSPARRLAPLQLASVGRTSKVLGRSYRSPLR